MRPLISRLVIAIAYRRRPRAAWNLARRASPTDARGRRGPTNRTRPARGDPGQRFGVAPSYNRQVPWPPSSRAKAWLETTFNRFEDLVARTGSASNALRFTRVRSNLRESGR